MEAVSVEPVSRKLDMEEEDDDEFQPPSRRVSCSEDRPVKTNLQQSPFLSPAAQKYALSRRKSDVVKINKEVGPNTKTVIVDTTMTKQDDVQEVHDHQECTDGVVG